jgi:hypothetical protein
VAVDPDILDSSSGEQWSIKMIAALLNLRFSPPPWTDRRVDNAAMQDESFDSVPADEFA